MAARSRLKAAVKAQSALVGMPQLVQDFCDCSGSYFLCAAAAKVKDRLYFLTSA